MTSTAPVILVAEDYPQMCSLLEEILQCDGYHVITAHNGLEALQRTLMSQPSLVIMDGNMPVMDGWETCVRIRQQRPNLPILMLTVQSEQQQRDRSFACGATMYMSKPFDAMALLEAVGELVGP